MKIADVVAQLRKIVPQVTDLFSTIIAVESIVGNGTVINVVTSSDHGLVDGDYVNLSGVSVETSITGAAQNGNNIIFTTDTDTDLTYGWPAHEFVTLVSILADLYENRGDCEASGPVSNAAKSLLYRFIILDM